MREYRYHSQPGCGGCLLMGALLLVVTGGLPLLINVLGYILAIGLGLMLCIIIFFRLLSWFIRRKVSEYERSQTEAHNRFVFLLVNILVNIAAIDGEVSRSELNAIYDFFRRHLNYNQDQIYWIKELTKEAMAARIGLEELLDEFKGSFGPEPRQILLELVYQVIYSKTGVSQVELTAAERIAAFLEINQYQAQAIHGKYRSQARSGPVGEERHYQVLGLSGDATFAEIKSAYRKLSMEYHPDKVAHLGEEFHKVAEEKMKEINGAYQYLKKKFGE
ncbi:MAG: DnaJ domain-containing protein [Desulfobulbaceae bacterium]|nr:DnaJ domain-containing protein [Desulfobulbaceae bacterium]